MLHLLPIPYTLHHLSHVPRSDGQEAILRPVHEDDMRVLPSLFPLPDGNIQSLSLLCTLHSKQDADEKYGSKL